MRIHSWIKLWLALALAAPLFLACTEEEFADDERARPEATAPAKVLTNVRISFNQRNLNVLDELLAGEFYFYFDEDDVGENPPGLLWYIIPETWNRDELLGALGNMYVLAYSIDLTIPTGGVGEPDAGAEAYHAEGVPVTFTVMVDDLTGYTSNQGSCDFEFEKYTNQSGETRWRLTGWWDNTRVDADGLQGTEPASLGGILAFYR
jgi:hypothetical protein